MNEPLINRKLLILLIVCPLAVYLGWILSDPMSFDALTFTGLLFGVLLIPLMLRWHRPTLIFSWNAAFTLAFLPGSPPLWMLVAFGGMLVVILESAVQKNLRLQMVSSINAALMVIGAVVLITAYVRGGIGMRAIGSSMYGGKKYVFIFAAIAGYFAMSTVRVPGDRIGKYTRMFFLSGLTHSASNLIFFAGPAFYWLYYFFPVSSAIQQAQAEFAGAEILRLGGFTAAMTAVVYYVLAKYPLREIFTVRRAGFVFLLLVATVVSALGGFRSVIIQFAIVFAIKFVLERLLWTRLFFGLIMVGMLIGIMAVPFAQRLPLSLQRSISFLPLDLDPAVTMDASDSTNWRLQMWSILWDDIPRYLLIGKGYVIDPTDMFMVEIAMTSGFATNYEGAIIAGDYHSGPLSVLVNFGIAGSLAFLAFCYVGIRSTYRNFKYGDDSLRNLNGLILAVFLMKVFFFFVIFGDFATDMAAFCGFLGFSVALNGGVRERATGVVRDPAASSAPVAPLVVGAGMATARMAGRGRAV